MKSLRSLSVTQYRIFAPDVVPFRALATPLIANSVKQTFGFRASEPNEAGELQFLDGTLVELDGSLLAIASATFSDRRVVLNVVGGSAAANRVFDAIAVYFGKFLEVVGLSEEPVFFTEVTIAVVELGFDWLDFFNPVLLDTVEAFANKPAMKTKAFLKGGSLQFTFGIAPDNERLLESGVQLVNKIFSIEPRNDVPLAERVYFTSSPTDSETHLRLVKELEANLAKKPGRRR